MIGIHSGGEVKRTWMGLILQVPDVIAGGLEVVAAGGTLSREPEAENGEPPPLAPSRGPPRSRTELVQGHDDRDAIQASPDVLPVDAGGRTTEAEPADLIDQPTRQREPVHGRSSTRIAHRARSD